MTPERELHISLYLSVALPDCTAGSHVDFQTRTSSRPVTSWVFTNRANFRHWSHPFGLAMPEEAPPASADVCISDFVIICALTPTNDFFGDFLTGDRRACCGCFGGCCGGCLCCFSSCCNLCNSCCCLRSCCCICCICMACFCSSCCSCICCICCSWDVCTCCIDVAGET